MTVKRVKGAWVLAWVFAWVSVPIHPHPPRVDLHSHYVRTRVRELHDVPAHARERVDDREPRAAPRLVAGDGLGRHGEPPLAVEGTPAVEPREEAEALPPAERRVRGGREERWVAHRRRTVGRVKGVEGRLCRWVADGTCAGAAGVRGRVRASTCACPCHTPPRGPRPPPPAKAPHRRNRPPAPPQHGPRRRPPFGFRAQETLTPGERKPRWYLRGCGLLFTLRIERVCPHTQKRRRRAATADRAPRCSTRPSAPVARTAPLEHRAHARLQMHL